MQKNDSSPAGAADAVNHPRHYTQHPSGIECIEIARHLPFNLGNAIKYIWRAGSKGDRAEDLRKAIWYLTDEIEHGNGGHGAGSEADIARRHIPIGWIEKTAGIIQQNDYIWSVDLAAFVRDPRLVGTGAHSAICVIQLNTAAISDRPPAAITPIRDPQKEEAL